MQRKSFWTYILLGSVLLVTFVLASGRCLHGQGVGTPLAQVEDGQSFSFQLEVEGRSTFYDDCRGLGSSNEVEEALTQTSGGVLVRQKAPGALEWHDITLKRSGPTDPNGVPVWSWRQATEDGDRQGAIRSGGITLWRNDRPAGALARWEFHNGWIASLEFNGSIEEMVIVHEGLERTDVISTPGPRPR